MEGIMWKGLELLIYDQGVIALSEEMSLEFCFKVSCVQSLSQEHWCERREYTMNGMPVRCRIPRIANPPTGIFLGGNLRTQRKHRHRQNLHRDSTQTVT